ncbi:MAG: DUF1592 domain-containing protein [Myxococcota bacterium]
MRQLCVTAAMVVSACLATGGCYSGFKGGADPGPTGADGTDGADDGGSDADGGSDDGGPLPDPDDNPPEPGAEFECDSDLQDPGPTLARRLNRTEYLNSVRDGLGIDAADLVEQLPPDYRAEGFTNTASALIVTTDDIAALAGVAEQIVQRLPDPTGFVAQYTTCTEFSAPCEEAFIAGIGKRLFRRPVEPMHVASLTPIFDHAQSEGDSFQDGAVAVVEAMLQSPHFMYRVEAQTAGDDGPYRTLDGYEIASRLSYLVWGSAPDDALMAAAESGALAEPDGRLAEVSRMVERQATRDTTHRFVGDWVHLDRLDHSGSALAADLREEIDTFVDDLVWNEERPLPELLNARYTFASEALATAYGLPNPQPGVQRYDLSDVPERAGMLTQGAVLSWEDGQASMVQRGLFVLREVICSEIASPPAGVNDTPPEPEPGKSKRYYAELRMSAAPCDGCHNQIDPIGFAFERYDGDGVWMTTDEHGNALRSDGELFTQFHDNLPFDDARELADILATDERVAECMLLNVTQFSLGRRLANADGCTLAAIRDSVSPEGATYQELLEAIVAQPSFAQVRIAEGE